MGLHSREKSEIREKLKTNLLERETQRPTEDSPSSATPWRKGRKPGESRDLCHEVRLIPIWHREIPRTLWDGREQLDARCARLTSPLTSFTLPFFINPLRRRRMRCRARLSLSSHLARRPHLHLHQNLTPYLPIPTTVAQEQVSTAALSFQS